MLMPTRNQDYLGLLNFLVSFGPHHPSHVFEERQGTLEREVIGASLLTREQKPIEQIDVVPDCFKI